MGRKRKPQYEYISEDAVQRIAKIMGPMSAAAQCLEKAAEYRARGSGVVYVTGESSMVVIELTEKAAKEAYGQ